MTYPLFVVAVAVVVLIIVMAKVIPTLADVFADLGGTLPLMTRMLIATSHFFAKWWLLMLAVLEFLKIGSQVYGNTPQGRIEKAKIMLSLPLVGAINQMNGAAQFANTMSVLLAAGITINQAVDTTAKVMDNALLSEDVRSMREGIERGRSLVECLQGKKYFPPTMVDMCSVGEETGELEETLDNVADYYANEADYRIQRLLAPLEPTMLVVLAIFAGIIVVSIYLPDSGKHKEKIYRQVTVIDNLFQVIAAGMRFQQMKSDYHYGSYATKPVEYLVMRLCYRLCL